MDTEVYINDPEALFMMMYENFIKGVKEEYYRGSAASLDEVWGSIEQEGFVDSVKENKRFIYHLYQMILNEYVKNGKGEIELNQMWKLFSKLMDNGLLPKDKKTERLYLDLGGEIIGDHRYRRFSGGSYGHSSEQDVVNRTKFLVAGLEVFDTTEYLFKAMDKAGKDCSPSAFWAYYGDFLKAIASVSPYEILTYLVLAEQVDRKDAPGGCWSNKAIWLADCAQELKNKIYYQNHYTFSEHEKEQLFGEDIEELYKKHIGSDELEEHEKEELDQYPQYIKKPSKRLYVKDSSFTYHTSSID